MPRYLGDTPFRELLAISIANDPTLKAAADALDAPFDADTRALPDLLVYARLARDSGFTNPVPMLPPMERLAALAGGLAELPEPVLDLLGWQLHVDGYEAAIDVRAKREMIQASLMLHRRKGTPWALRRGLETALRLPVEIPEWFRYGGDPYFFRVRQDVTGREYPPELGRNTIRLIFEHKNVRSWLEYLRTHSTNPLPAYVGLAAVTRVFSAARPWFYVPPTPRARILAGLGVYGVVRARLWPVRPAPRPATVRPRLGLAVIGYTRSSLCPTPR